MKSSLERYKLLILLLLTDLIFLVLHLLFRYTSLGLSNDFSIVRERSYAEFFQYTKELWIFSLFLLMALRQRKLLFGVMSALFLFLLFDDSFEIHENFGAFLAAYFRFPSLFGLRPVDLGELLVYAFYGALFFVAVGLAYHLAAPAARRIARPVILLVLLLVFFGVFLDMLEIVITHPLLSGLVQTLEELGEMIVMSVITWRVFRFELSPPQPPPAVPPAAQPA